MLSALHIENIAIIERADIRMDAGFGVLTGETGAGKSIIIDAIGAILGGRTSRELIRTGASCAKVSALFSGLTDDVRAFLAENGIDAEDNELLIRREISPDGRGVCRINASPCTVAMLRNLGTLLINIHGQHDSQQLLDPACHMGYLDSFSNDASALSEYSDAYALMSKTRESLNALLIDDGEKARRTDMLRFMIDELESADLTPNEEDQLNARRILLKNAERVSGAAQGAYLCFFGDEESAGINASLLEASRVLSEAGKYAPALLKLGERASALLYEAEDISDEIRAFRAELELSPGELDAVESRLDRIYRLKKYGATTVEMLGFLAQKKKELDEITFSEECRQALERALESQRSRAQKLACALTRLRKEAAAAIEGQVTQELSQLDMASARFCVLIADKPLGPDGADEVSFLLSANAGEELRPLSKVASGGELARIMLALKSVLSKGDQVETLIFDEVDSGVSGRAAQKLAQKLADLSGKKQVLCVTHLAQIAAMADAHFLIEKSESDGRTRTKVTPLDDAARAQELSRLTGGAVITETTLSNARELIAAARTYKNRRGTL